MDRDFQKLILYRSIIFLTLFNRYQVAHAKLISSSTNKSYLLSLSKKHFPSTVQPNDALFNEIKSVQVSKMEPLNSTTSSLQSKKHFSFYSQVLTKSKKKYIITFQRTDDPIGP